MLGTQAATLAGTIAADVLKNKRNQPAHVQNNLKAWQAGNREHKYTTEADFQAAIDAGEKDALDALRTSRPQQYQQRFGQAQQQQAPAPQQEAALDWGGVRGKIQSGEWTNRQGRDYIQRHGLQSPAQQRGAQPAPPPVQSTPTTGGGFSEDPGGTGGQTLEDKIRGGQFGTQGPTKTWDPTTGTWRYADGSVAEAPKGVTVGGPKSPPPQTPAPQPGPFAAPMPAPQAPRPAPRPMPQGPPRKSTQQIADEIYQRNLKRMQPQMDARRRQFEQTLVDQGISKDSDAYRNRLAQFEQAQNDALTEMSYRAMRAGFAEDSRRFGQMDANRRFAASRTDADRGYGLARDRFAASRVDADRGYGLARDRFGHQVGQDMWGRDFAESGRAEDIRRYDQGFAEDTRRHDQGFAEGQRQFDVNTALQNRALDLQRLDSDRQYEIQKAATRIQGMVAKGQIDNAKARVALDLMIYTGMSEDEAIEQASRGGG